MSCKNKYMFFNFILSLLILNINSKVKIFLFDNSKFQDSTNKDNLNNISNFLFNNNKHNLD